MHRVLISPQSCPQNRQDQLIEASPCSAVSPAEYATSLLLSETGVGKEQLDAYQFVTPDESLLDSYRMDVVSAVRNNDLVKLQSLAADGQDFNACNRNGETLLHLACRCADIATVHFLLAVGGVNVNVIDSLGRSVLHDICWRHKLDLDLMSLFVGRIDPYLFVLKDKRGHACFDYCRKEHYSCWINFLHENSSRIVAGTNPITTSCSEIDKISHVADSAGASVDELSADAGENSHDSPRRKRQESDPCPLDDNMLASSSSPPSKKLRI